MMLGGPAFFAAGPLGHFPSTTRRKRMLKTRGIQKYAAEDNSIASPSFRDPWALSGTLAGVSFVGGVAGAIAMTDSPYPRPGSEPAEIRRYFEENSGAARISVAGQLISAAALARFTA